MRITSVPSVLVAAAAMWLIGCEPDESDMGPGTTINQNPGQAGYDAGTSPDAASPGAPGGGSGPGGGGFDAGGVNDGSVGPGWPDTGTGVGNGQEASVPDAAPSEAGPAGDASLPAEGGAGGYSPCPGGGMPCKILPLGDSITSGLGYAGGYRVELFRLAHAANHNITFVGTASGAFDGPNGPTTVDGVSFPRAHEGHSGWTISQVAELVPSPALSMKPNIVLLMAGTNDVTFGGGASAPRAIGNLIDALVSADPNMLIVVAQITPRGSAASGPRPDSGTESLNRGLPAEVERRASAGKHVLLVDMYTGFPMNGLGDSVHPNKTGYDWMAGVWYKAIAPVLR